MDWLAGPVADSPTPTPRRASASWAKEPAADDNIVMRLQNASAHAMMLRRFAASASRAMGTLAIV